MNKLYPYEKRMADKLRQMPVTGKDTNWEMMKTMLDEADKRPLSPPPFFSKIGGGKILIAALVMVAGLLLQQNLKNNKPALAIKKARQQNNITPGTGTNAATKNNIYKSDINVTQPNILADEKKTADAEKKYFNTNENIPANNPVNAPAVTLNSLTGSNLPVKQQHNKKQGLIVARNKTILTKQQKLLNQNTEPGVNSNSSNPLHFFNHHNSLFSLAFEKGVKSPAAVLYRPVVLPAAKIKNNQLLVANETRKERRELKRSFSNRKINNTQDVVFAAGLVLPKSLAIAQQQSPGYNVNGKANLISDYLPGAYLQYHLTDKFFVHSEFQFQSPQYTNQLLVQQNSQLNNAGLMVNNKVFIEKLYYFNLPLTVNYSPLPNFYIGTGVQYSSLISGIARYQKTVGQNVNASVARFQDDTVANLLNPKDLRWQMDANYYYRRFTLGARYNQAFNNVADIQVSQNVRTISRNKAFQFYIRYNLWEDKKKKDYFTSGY
jgi:hypothetical protein